MAIIVPQAADPSAEDNEYDELSFEERAAHYTGPASKKKLYALIIGISDYQDDVVLTQEGVVFPKLSGCRSDALKIEAYLKEDSSFDVESLLLTDEQATKSNIITAFQEHLAKAEKGDVAFFYFSGHGTQEYVDKDIFSSETDGKSESIVCYYTDDTANQALLSDKELRWLISNLQPDHAHVLTIFDCCHSAGATRNAALVGSSFHNVVEKRIYHTFPQRNWDEYAFAEKLSVEEFIKTGEGSALPEGKHIQISACESYESALEVNAEGVFTKTLLKVLRGSRGSITYSSLVSQIRQYLQGVYEQKPRIYYTGTDDYLFVTLFLNKAYLPAAGPVAEVVFNDEYGWILNRGSIHGMETVKMVKLYHPDSPQIFVEAIVDRTEIDHSILTAEGLQTDVVYLTYVPQLLSEKIKLFIPENTAHFEDQLHILDSIIEELTHKVLLKDSERESDYVIRYLNGSYYITLPNDPYRPIAEQIDAAGKGSRVKLIKQLEHLSAVGFIRNLKNTNPQTTLNKASVKIEVSVAGAPYTVYDTDELEIEFLKNGNHWANTLKIRLSNLTDKILYCSAILLPFDFASFTGLLNPSVYTLTPTSSVELNIKGNSSLPLRIGRALRWYNWQTYKEYLKILISTEIFDAEAFLMGQLSSPVIPGESVMGIGYAQVPIIEDKRWYVRDINMVFKNPTFNQISQADLNIMLDDERTTFFALGLYFEPDNTSGFEFKYKISSDIILIDPEGTHKGVIVDLANKFSRLKRNRQYQRDIKRFPEKIRIVSEGDSWFQHPLVHDIIDHVSRTFPTYCVSAAADTLRNIMSGDHRRGEYFLDAIRREKPAIFLLSGGGNDILGSQFQSYLADSPYPNKDEGQMPERFLKTSLMEEIVSLMEIYRTVFIQLKTEFPALKVIVHGYDYPIKLDEAKKGWLGRYMIAKGIDRPGDRKAIIRYIMDNFNALLEDEVARAPNATYLNIRNIVRYNSSTGVDQWYDEIHPNHDGFQQVSMRFIQKINELIQPSVI